MKIISELNNIEIDGSAYVIAIVDKAGRADNDKSNIGDQNSGARNSGDQNSGCWNSGCRNSGDWNSGDQNSGCWNTGDWNSGDWNSGIFNTDSPQLRAFNKETDVKLEDIDFPDFLIFNITEWIDLEDMTDEEKKEHPEYKITCGYLKVCGYKEAFKKSWDAATIDDKKKALTIPNFDNEIFKEISGIDVVAELNCLGGNKDKTYYRS